MINQQLLDYVRAQKAVGLSKEAIMQALAAGGWTAADVNEAFMALEGVKIPPPPPPQPPAQPMQPAAPRTIVPPVGMTPTARPVMSAAELSTAPAPKRRSWLAIILITFFMLIIIGGVAAAVIWGPAKVLSMIPGIETILPGMTESTDAQNFAPVDETEEQQTPLLDTGVDFDTTVSTDAATTSSSTQP